jgi:site-specific DNA-methyltransferase (adenine-specific)
LNTPDVFVRTARGQYRLRTDEAEQLSLSGEPLNLAYKNDRTLLFQGDCLDWLQGAAPASIHAVVTDPPYGLVEYTSREQRKLRSGRGGVWRIPPAFDGHQRAPLPRFTTLSDAEIDQLDIFFARWARAIFRVLVPGGHVVIASNPLLSYVVAGAVVRSGFERRGEIIRLVMTMRGGDRPKNAHKEFPDVSVMPRSMWEPWLLFRKPLDGRVQDNLRKWKTGGLRRISEDRPFGDVIQSHPTRADERALAPHPSLKPQAFLRQVVRAVLPLAEGVVLDPFAGSGSTLAAAEAIGYESIGIEKDQEYVKLAKCAIPKLSALKIRK